MVAEGTAEVAAFKPEKKPPIRGPATLGRPEEGNFDTLKSALASWRANTIPQDVGKVLLVQ